MQRSPFALVIPLALLAGIGLVATGCVPSLASRSAGYVGCPPDEIVISNEDSGIGTHTWTASCRGAVYYCSFNRGNGDMSCAAATAPPSVPDRSSDEPSRAESGLIAYGREPKGAVGFSFGADVKEAEQTCSSAGFSWKSPEADERFSCSGSPVDFGLPAEVRVSFCNDKICEVTVDVNTEGATWKKLGERYRMILATLEGKYGEIYKQKTERLEDCTDDDIKDCFAKGRGRTSASWHWQSGQTLDAVLDGGASSRPSLQLVYGNGKKPKPRQSPKSNGEVIKPGL